MHLNQTRTRRRERITRWRRGLSYRLTMQVRIYVRYFNGTCFPVCPRCEIPIERDYMSYCDRCGQKLGWDRLNNVQYRSPQNKGKCFYRKKRIRATIARHTNAEELCSAEVIV